MDAQQQGSDPNPCGSGARWNRDNSSGISRRRLLGWAGGAGAALAGLLVGHRGQLERARAQAGASIVGTWRVAPAPQGASAEQVLNIFTSDGAVIQNSSPGSSTGIGIWNANPDGSIGVTFEQLLYMPQSAPSPGSGPPASGGPSGPPPAAGRNLIVATVQLDGTGNTFNGRFRFTISQTDGTVLQAGTGSVTGTRMQVEAL